ncbi:pyridoxamine 5'-phosphate oxidase family protein [Variovorax sp. J22G21]|uniref:pyridoxamine 5'-phosphate oxidase family protein n=1 Tax=Variovorax fucosicus TaxID=3053517 RepID=UPI002574DA58|nr:MULTISPECIES: pyridoxamine 5'-phosphate oxidase family protein [unclassified Variovorax]MDM0040352.1 pyridoxamine 5'-phosphate oxidase family protein [Variovorax sp. J22R193]MDM0058471.1 pyridoxamine 5'-phosphate oxidase family protein [Variovorax sp. J22G47]MDM0061725.1 pyridoxamine 5'-phosphate oxidase family protein [Variovorax sp. J22G21]
MTEKYEVTDRTTLKRRPHRGIYDKEAIQAILDEGFMCNVAYVHDGAPRVLPTGYGRIGDYIYIHGSNQSTMLTAALSGEVCVLVTHVDGLVLARSLYNHSVNYRSVVVFGRPEEVTDPEEKLASFEAYARHVLKGRFADVRPPNSKELNSTTVMRIAVSEAVAKLRSGPPTDFEFDLDRDCWAGELLIKQVFAGAVRDPHGRQDVPLPQYVQGYEKLPSVEQQKVENAPDT